MRSLFFSVEVVAANTSLDECRVGANIALGEVNYTTVDLVLDHVRK